ncbi:deleted in malignant brain tumors 1 protein-like [Neoarius graeffei]|uniref:deleted in malignant brain tumors 1 protein-like n=1 Tax=Neoarius graeffei TaxID=443677 RepID=UPI00298C5DD2|nr:deleted in malignant brain tumors 1 protein-like [Neoarius graeffei]
MEFGFVLFLLSSALFEHSSGFTTWVVGSCSGLFTEQEGVFASPNYPNRYPHYAHCTWTIRSLENKFIALRFSYVNIESNPGCSFDAVRVYDGPSTSSPLLGRLCGSSSRSFGSSGNNLTIVFSSDGSVDGRGFVANWYFTDYCYYTTTAPAPACGGRLHGSGSISSPYYPNYYHDNAYCEWQLSAPAGQTIFLSFQDLDLERCCSCDYVKVYDGSYVGSRLLGTVCYNDTNHLDFQSSSSYMTVLFRSDYSGVGRGFKASFSSSLSSNTGRVDCSSEKMKITIRRSYLDSMGFNWHDLYLDDHRCTPSADYYYVTFNFPIHSCSTRREAENGRIIYTNNVRAAQSTSGEITRQDTSFLMRVRCVMERDSSVGTLYEALENNNATISGTGRFNTSMAFYPSSSFSYPITESPYKVNLNQQLYVQVQLTRAEPTLHLFMDTCVASPNNDFSIRTYDLIRNGCAKDSTVYIYRNGNRYFAQFRFRAFKFLRTHSQVFLRCDVIICVDNDYNSRCRQGCRYRKKRSLSSDHRTEVVTLGPITLKDQEEAVAKIEDKN